MCCRHCHKLLRQHPSSEPLLAGGVVPAAVTSEDWAKPALRASHNTRRTQRSPGCQLGLFCSLLPLQGCGQPSWAGIKDQCQPWCGSAGQGDQGINLFSHTGSLQGRRTLSKVDFGGFFLNSFCTVTPKIAPFKRVYWWWRKNKTHRTSHVRWGWVGSWAWVKCGAIFLFPPTRCHVLE